MINIGSLLIKYSKTIHSYLAKKAELFLLFFILQEIPQEIRICCNKGYLELNIQ